jgi:hypothetical protein
MRTCRQVAALISVLALVTIGSASGEMSVHFIDVGHALCDAGMRKYVLPSGAPAPQWPYPEYALDQPIPQDAINSTQTGPGEAP